MNAEKAPYRLRTWTERVRDQEVVLTGLDDFESNLAALYGALKGDNRAVWSPMFGVIWGSARAVAERICDRRAELVGKSYLELGCGLGLPGILAARFGARALLTDYHPHTEAFLRRNLVQNGVPNVPYQTLDWVGDPGGTRHEIVVATDVLFAHDLPVPLARAFAATLAPGGVGWLADPGRAWLSEFARAARDLGLSVDEDVVRVQAPHGPEDIFLLELRPPG